MNEKLIISQFRQKHINIFTICEIILVDRFVGIASKWNKKQNFGVVQAITMHHFLQKYR